MALQKKIPLRKCVATGEMHPKKRNDPCSPDKRRRSVCRFDWQKSGRGAYVSKSEDAIELARKRKFWTINWKLKFQLKSTTN
ncbi:YlxR family protein [Planococcus glaciei]|nr:YlxR family protein [Planococcus glaciei]